MAFSRIGWMHFTVQETEQSGGPPTTSNFNPEACELEIIRTTYAWFPNLGMETHAILGSTHRNLRAEDTAIRGISYIVGIRNKLSDELWKCVICPDNYGTHLLVNGSMYKIGVFTNPCGAQTTTSNMDMEGRSVRQHEGVLNVIMAATLSYTCSLVLINSEGNILSVLVRQEPALQLGLLFPLELPRQRRGPTGVQYSYLGRKLLRHFQDLANNGLYDAFEQRFQRLKEILVDKRYGFQDLIPRIQLEGSVMALVQSNWDEFEGKASEALKKAEQFHTPNIEILWAVLKYRRGTVKRLQGDFIAARECMEEAQELLQLVGPCEEVAEFYHHWFSLLADERGNSRDVHRLEPGSPEPELVYHLAIENWQRGCEQFSRVIPLVDFEVRAAVRLVNYHLQTSRDRAPVLSGRVGPVDLNRAESVLRSIERQPLHECQTRVQAGHYLAKTDFHLLQGSFEEGFTAVKKCLEISRRLQLKKYTDGGEARLTLLHQLTGHMQVCEDEPAEHRFRRPSQGDDFDDLLTELDFELAGQPSSLIALESNPAV